MPVPARDARPPSPCREPRSSVRAAGWRRGGSQPLAHTAHHDVEFLSRLDAQRQVDAEQSREDRRRTHRNRYEGDALHGLDLDRMRVGGAQRMHAVHPVGECDHLVRRDAGPVDLRRRAHRSVAPEDKQLVGPSGERSRQGRRRARLGRKGLGNPVRGSGTRIVRSRHLQVALRQQAAAFRGRNNAVDDLDRRARKRDLRDETVMRSRECPPDWRAVDDVAGVVDVEITADATLDDRQDAQRTRTGRTRS